MNIRHMARYSAIVALAFVAATALPALAQTVPNLSDAIPLREIGPTRQGGRYVDFAVVESNPRIFYAATASGGLWKTENHGTTFTSIFDDQPVISIGAVALSQSNPDVVYVGTGEANNSRSSYFGNGVYKSTDAGRTWQHMGLPESHHIGRIAVHPTDPNTVYVAALGHLYSENPDRGLYKTTDGGRSWTKVLDHRVDGRAIGVVDVAMDPTNPQILYAATYDKVRKPWTFGEGGPGSGIFKTTNGGASWTQMAGGLPSGLLGRIGLSIYRRDPNTVYAIIENANGNNQNPEERRRRMALGFGGGTSDQLFRTDDAGQTWRQVAPAPAAAGDQAGRAGGRGAGGDTAAARGGGGGGGRGGGGFTGGNPPYYYGQVRVDPNNRDHVYVLSVGMSHSLDGGRTWSTPFGGGDNHALWINPNDSNHILLGYDHGMWVSFDGGRTNLRPDNIPLAQFYAVGYDMEYPYNVYGGLQDNGSVKGPSTKRGGGTIVFEDWYRVGGGDGMYNVVDPNDSRWLYNESQFGAIQRVDQLTGQSQGIRYNRPGRGGGGRGGRGAAAADQAGAAGRAAGAGAAAQTPTEPLRWNWNAPILISPHNSDVIYHAAQVLLRSPFRGNSWEEISPDLTRNLPDRRGGTGNIQYATITTVDESPIIPGLIWVGTDDGNVQVTRNGGGSWTDVTSRITGHPGFWVSRVIASYHDPAVAYVTVTGYRHDDFRPFVWKTTNYGESWTAVTGNLPNQSINVIREDRKNPNLLFVGTDLGVHTSLDGGRTWTQLRNGIPTNPVHDLQIHPRENELIVATHGRGIFIADISPLQSLTTQTVSSDAQLLDIQPTIQWITGQRPVAATINFNGQSRPNGVAIYYYLRSAASTAPTIRVYDGARVIAETTGPAVAGINMVRWNMQARRDPAGAPDQGAVGRGAGAGGGRGGGGGGGAPPGGGRGGRGGATVFPAGGGAATTVGPGDYRVVLSVNGREYTKTATIIADHWFRKE